MAKRKMLTTANGPRGAFVIGQTYDFEALGLEDLGQEFEDAGAAERVWSAAVEGAAPRAAVEKSAEASIANDPGVPEEGDEERGSEPLPRWPLRRWSPASYLEEHAKDAKHFDLATRYMEAGKPNG